MKTIQSQRGTVEICHDSAELADIAAKEFTRIVQEAIKLHGRCTVALSGGSTPPILYEKLVSPEYRDAIHWNKVFFFVGDERCVEHASKESNWGVAERLLLDKLDIPAHNRFPTSGQDSDPDKCAANYEQSLQEFFFGQGLDLPRFDLIILGMGPDGHTASLFPGSKALDETKRLVVDNYVDKFETHRITFTFPLINNASHVLFLLQGKEKSHVLSEVFESRDVLYPIQRVVPKDGKTIWIVDDAAASALKDMVK